MEINEEIETAAWIGTIKKERPRNYKPYTTTLKMQTENSSSNNVSQSSSINLRIIKQKQKQSVPLATIDEDFSFFDDT